MKMVLENTGKKYGLLTVVSRDINNKSGATHWICVCECGETVSKAGIDLRKGEKRNETTACSRMCKYIILPKGEQAFNSLFAHYRIDSEKRAYRFSLTKDQFKHLINQTCFYCGESPSGKWGRERYGKLIYNGIDRRDNSRGYTIDNCVPCCKTCNYAKLDRDFESYIKWVHKSSKHLNLKNLMGK